eukprot:1053692-Amphidinium_carterae.1
MGTCCRAWLRKPQACGAFFGCSHKLELYTAIIINKIIQRAIHAVTVMQTEDNKALNTFNQRNLGGD